MKPHKVEILFDSRSFDVASEPPNDINPIRGQSFLAWLAPRLEGDGYQARGPNTEDWGWYLDVLGPSGRYLVGAIAIPCKDDVVDWMLQIWRSRSLRERIRGEGRIGLDDPLVRRIEAAIREHAGSSEIVVELFDDRGRALEQEARP